MMAAMRGKIYCVKKLLDAGANVCEIQYLSILVFLWFFAVPYEF